MPSWSIVLLIVVVGAVTWIFRKRIFHGHQFAQEIQAVDFANGQFPPQVRAACATMQAKVSDAVTKYYGAKPAADTAADLLPFYGKTYRYNLPLEQLCTRIEVVDSLAGGAQANIWRRDGGEIVMQITKASLQKDWRYEHEFAHALTWPNADGTIPRPELWLQCQRAPGNHWSVIWDGIGY